MRKIRGLFITVCFCCVAISSITAQTDEITKKDVMSANRKVFDLVDRYALYSDFSKQKNSTWFNYLFRQNNLMQVPKDLLPWFESGTDDLDMTTLMEYKAFAAAHSDELQYYEVKDAHIIKTEIKSGQIDYQVEVTKVETMKKNNVTDSCKVVLHITYDRSSGDVLITGITWSEKGSYFQPYLMAKYVVKDTKSKMIPKTIKTAGGVTLGSKPVVIGQQDHAMNNLEPDVAPLYLDSTVNARERVYFAKNNKNSLGLSADILFGVDNMEKKILAGQGNYNFDSLNASVFSWHVGLNYYRQLLLSGRNRLGLDLGLMVGLYQMTFGCDYDEQYVDIDDDDAVYNRFVTIRDFRERTSNVSLVVPVALRYDGFLSRNLSFAFSVGVKGQVLVPRKSNAEFDGAYSGRYPNLFDIYIDQQGYYDFGSFEGCEVENEGGNASKSFAASAFGTIGLQYFITNKWSVDLHVMYDYLFTKALNEPVARHLSTSHESYQSLTYFMRNLPQHNIGLNVRVKYNF